jgi:tetratricopeptide (TPR) repeat protein
MRLLLSVLILSAVGTLGVVPTRAQGARASGQIFLPNGEPIAAVTRFVLTSEDPRRDPEIHYTDSQGRFHLQGLSANRWYTVSVDSDKQNFAATAETFLAGARTHVVVNLRALEISPLPPTEGSVSVPSLQRRPLREAQRAYDRGAEALRKNQLQRARAEFQRAIQIDPHFVAAYNDLAVLAIGERKYAEAEKWLVQAREKDADALHVLLNLGIALNYQKRFAEAIPPLRRALQLRPNWPAPAVYLGIALLETDMLAEAEPMLRRGTHHAERREEALAYLYLGKLYAQRGENDRALVAWEVYLEKDPNSVNAAQVRQFMEQLRRIKPQ